MLQLIIIVFAISFLCFTYETNRPMKNSFLINHNKKRVNGNHLIFTEVKDTTLMQYDNNP